MVKKLHWSGARRFWEGALGALWNRSPPRSRWLELIPGNVFWNIVDILCFFKGSPNFETHPHAVAMYIISPCDLTKSSLIGSAMVTKNPDPHGQVLYERLRLGGCEMSNQKTKMSPKKRGPFRKESSRLFSNHYFSGEDIYVFFSGCTLKSANQVQVSHLFLMKS